MIKSKILTRQGRRLLWIKGQKGQQVNEREAVALSRREVRGLLPVEVVQKGATYELFYDLTACVTLRDFLAAPLSKGSFAGLLQDVLETLRGMQETYFNAELLMLDVERVMVENATGCLRFVYVPLAGHNCETSLREFLLDLVRHCAFTPGENTDYVREYITLLNKSPHFSAFELEEYIDRLQKSVDTLAPTCPACGAPLPSDAYFCTACGHAVASPPAEAPLFEEVPPVPEEVATRAFLVHPNRGVQIPIDHFPFRVGKEVRSCDYAVPENKAVSRTHADVIRRDGRYYIRDLDSTNGTYLNGQPIPPKQEVELLPEMQVRLANEVFLFCVSHN